MTTAAEAAEVIQAHHLIWARRQPPKSRPPGAAKLLACSAPGCPFTVMEDFDKHGPWHQSHEHAAQVLADLGMLTP